MQIQTRIIQLLLLVLGLSTTACRHSHLQDMDPVFTKRMRIAATYENEWQYPISEGTDWKNYQAWEETFHLPYNLLTPRIPEGLRVQLYLGDQKANIFNLAPEGGEIPLTNGEQSLLLFNNNTEYIVFDELDSHKMATATTRSRSRNSRPGDEPLGGLTEQAMNTPDMLYATYIDSYKGQDHSDIDTLSVVMKPLVYSYLIQYEFSKGMEHIALAKGALTGMADAVSLSDQQTSSKTATLLFSTTLRDFGAQALIRSFGIPDYPREGSVQPLRKHQLELEVKFRDGKVQQFKFDVTDQVVRQPRGGVIRVTDIAVDKSQGQASNNSGFDVDVSDWGPNEQVQIPL